MPRRPVLAARALARENQSTVFGPQSTAKINCERWRILNCGLTTADFSMTDFFALLDEPHRPWLEPEALKAKFLALAAQAHPDKQIAASETEKLTANRRYAELNAAYRCLAEPQLRLRHLLELELGAKPAEVQQIPAALANLFAEVATTCRNTDAFLAEKNKATSPLMQVQLFERAQKWVERLQTLQTKLTELHNKLTKELKSLDALWISKAQSGERLDLLKRLEELYRLFGYFNRWRSQIQEQIVQLSL
jgi:DnaJ-domain-containing protein 1